MQTFNDSMKTAKIKHKLKHGGRFKFIRKKGFWISKSRHHCLKTQTLLLQFKNNNATSMYVTKLFIARKFMLLFLICKKHAS